jgi:hypothetical protein
MTGRHKFHLSAVILIVIGLILSGCTMPPHCSAEWLILSINNANSNGPGLDTIDLAPGCIYELGVVDNTIDGNNGLPSITSTIKINGHGATVRRSTGAQKAAIRLFHVSQAGALELFDIILLDGSAAEPTDITLLFENSGGAIFNSGVVTVNNSLITANRAFLKGGGIYNTGTLTVNNSTIEKNVVDITHTYQQSGGGILNTGTATINNTTISNNQANHSAGGIGNNGNLTIHNSTISGNTTTLSGIASGAALVDLPPEN